jgi:hypothetical protein
MNNSLNSQLVVTIGIVGPESWLDTFYEHFYEKAINSQIANERTLLNIYANLFGCKVLDILIDRQHVDARRITLYAEKDRLATLNTRGCMLFCGTLKEIMDRLREQTTTMLCFVPDYLLPPEMLAALGGEIPRHAIVTLTKTDPSLLAEPKPESELTSSLPSLEPDEIKEVYPLEKNPDGSVSIRQKDAFLAFEFDTEPPIKTAVNLMSRATEDAKRKLSEYEESNKKQKLSKQETKTSKPMTTRSGRLVNRPAHLKTDKKTTNNNDDDDEDSDTDDAISHDQLGDSDEEFVSNEKNSPSDNDDSIESFDVEERAVSRHHRQEKTKSKSRSVFSSNGLLVDMNVRQYVSFAPLPKDAKLGGVPEFDQEFMRSVGDVENLQIMPNAKWLAKQNRVVDGVFNNGLDMKARRLGVFRDLSFHLRMTGDPQENCQGRCNLCDGTHILCYEAQVHGPLSAAQVKAAKSVGFGAMSKLADNAPDTVFAARFGSNCAEMVLRTMYYYSTLGVARRTFYKALVNPDRATIKDFGDLLKEKHFPERIKLAHEALVAVLPLLNEKGRYLIPTDLTIGRNTPAVVTNWST